MKAIRYFLLTALVVGLTAVPRAAADECDHYPMLFADSHFKDKAISVRQSIVDLDDYDFNDKASSICVPHGWTLVLYEHDDFEGARVTVEGYSRLSELDEGGFHGQNWSDRISSIEVFRGRTAYGGARPAERRYEDDWDDAPRRGRYAEQGRGRYNRHRGMDRGQRGRPYRPGGAFVACDVPVLAKHDEFKGPQLSLTRSELDLDSLNFDDTVSSICVPAGWTLVLFEDENFRGERWVIDGPVEVLNLEYERSGKKDWNDRISSVRVLSPTGERRSALRID